MRVLHLIFSIFSIIHLALSSTVPLSENTKYVTDFFREFQKFDLENVKTRELEKLAHFEDFHGSSNQKKCLRCQINAHVIIQYAKANYSTPYLKRVALELCTIFKPVPVNSCHGFIEIFTPTIEYILHNTPNLNADKFCSIHFQHVDCGPKFEPEKVLVHIDHSTTSKLTASKPLTVTDKEPLTIVHISDPHYDPNYVAGGNANCLDEGIACCQRFQGLPRAPEDSAGYWGDYRSCDSPRHAVNETFHHIRRQHEKIDYIYFTGDIVDHFVDQTSVQGNAESIKFVMRLLKDVFGDVPVFPVLGNHDAHPANLYPSQAVPLEFSQKWLYDLILNEWSPWIPAKDLQTVSDGGYYTTLVRPGLRVIALNSNFAYLENYWLFFDDELFVPQLQWLHDTLLQAELQGEKVHILSHVPVQNEMFHKFAFNYKLIVERFAHIISAQFNGHTHEDEFNIFYASYNKDIALNVAWNGGSTVTFVNVNPNYCVYGVDGGSFEILDRFSWIYNLTEANREGTPHWYMEYSFKEAFESDLSPASVDALITRFSTDKALLQKYWTYKHKSADPQLERGCNDDCLKEHLCRILHTDRETRSFCKSNV